MDACREFFKQRIQDLVSAGLVVDLLICIPSAVVTHYTFSTWSQQKRFVSTSYEVIHPLIIKRKRKIGQLEMTVEQRKVSQKGL
ncbi:hypothetical protein E2C01_052055 [Portunus trituberculatus]|uniref:Uncharacterized protein n=1 Tax=Portunus trituberculatus TaxID=210409 RepID=A0A5B7GDF1_PORTR|nr:hypothetical protein [Portunus trituberculatus]